MITDDPKHPGINKPGASGQNEAYLVLSDAERAKGFVRPVRRSYRHAGVRPKHPLLDLTPEQLERFPDEGFVKYEQYPEGAGPMGRYWTQEQLDSGCGAVTTMAAQLAETYARQPTYYGSTWCCGCGRHIRVAEFVWDGTDQVVGS